MIRPTMLAATLALLLIDPCPGQVATGPTPAVADAEVYKAARSALADARNRASSRDLSTRKRAIESMTESAKTKLAARFAISRERLDAIIAEGERSDGTAARKATTSAKLGAKAEVREQLDAVAVTPSPARPGIPPGLSRRDYSTVVRATTGRSASPALPAPAPGPTSAERDAMTPGIAVALARPGPAGNLHLATDGDAFRQLRASVASGDFRTFQRLRAENKVLVIVNGTRAVILEVGDRSRRVRVLDGANRDAEGWVEVRYLSAD